VGLKVPSEADVQPSASGPAPVGESEAEPEPGAEEHNGEEAAAEVTSSTELEAHIVEADNLKKQGDTAFTANDFKNALGFYVSAIKLVGDSTALYDAVARHALPAVEPDVHDDELPPEHGPHVICFKNLLQSNKAETLIKIQGWSRNDSDAEPWDPHSGSMDNFRKWADPELEKRAEMAAEYLPESYRLKYGQTLEAEAFGVGTLHEFLESPHLNRTVELRGSGQAGLTVHMRDETGGGSVAYDRVKMTYTYLETKSAGSSFHHHSRPRTAGVAHF
jgi:hypothetical protein